MINFFGLNKYTEGNKFIEYGHMANDPVIGNRFAQDEDKAPLDTLRARCIVVSVKCASVLLRNMVY